MSFKHINVILDLDNTLISAEESKEFDFDKYHNKSMNFTFHNMENYFIVFERPNVQEFLDFIFKEFTVSVWTAASKDYALFVINKVILENHPERKLNYIFYSYHCDISYNKTKNTKCLKMLWDEYKLTEFKPNNTIIIDDYSEVYKTNPKNCKQIYEFNYFDENSEKDSHLLNVIPLLKSLASNNSIGNTMICDYKDYSMNKLPNDSPILEESRKKEVIESDTDSSYSTIESDSSFNSDSDSIDTESLLSIDIKPVKKLNKKKIIDDKSISDSDSDYSDSKSSNYSSNSLSSSDSKSSKNSSNSLSSSDSRDSLSSRDSKSSNSSYSSVSSVSVK